MVPCLVEHHLDFFLFLVILVLQSDDLLALLLEVRLERPLELLELRVLVLELALELLHLTLRCSTPLQTLGLGCAPLLREFPFPFGTFGFQCYPLRVLLPPFGLTFGDQGRKSLMFGTQSFIPFREGRGVEAWGELPF